MKTHRGYRHRFFPTPEQVDNLSRTFGCARWSYNRMLTLRLATFLERQERLYYKPLGVHLAQLKRGTDKRWLDDEAYGVCLQQGLRHLDVAFTKSVKNDSDYPLKSLALGQRHRRCPRCFTRQDRDEKAVKKIFASDTALLADADAQWVRE